MNSGRFDDEIWDEFQWEAHIEEIEKQGQQLRKFINSHSADQDPRWYRLMDESYSEIDAVDAFVEEELSIDETYFPDEEDDDFDEDESDDIFLFGDDDLENLFDEDYNPFEDLEGDDEEDDFDKGEEWKQLSSDFAMTDNGSIEQLPAYVQAREVAALVLRWAHAVHHRKRPAVYFQMVNEVLQISTKLAAGYSFGFEIDYLGANIAYCKKALSYANSALSSLRSQKDASYMKKGEYSMLHENIFELRNDIGIYVQDLREQFYNRYF